MNDAEKRAVLSIGWMAAFADGAKVERERDEVQRLAAALVQDAPGASHDGALVAKTAAQLAGELTSPGARQFAYETAVCVCNADGAQTEAERRFLAELRR